MTSLQQNYNEESNLIHYSGNVFVTKGIVGNGGNVCYRADNGEFVVIGCLNRKQSLSKNLDRSIFLLCRAFGSSAIHLL